MCIEIISLGKFDYSVFELSPTEELIISNMIKYDISHYHITKNIKTNNIEFFMNSSVLNSDQANKLFSHMFDLLEQDFPSHKTNDFSIFILQYGFHFSRIQQEKENFQQEKENFQQVTWNIECANIDRIKLELFDFFHKNIFYQHLVKKLKKKNLFEKVSKI